MCLTGLGIKGLSDAVLRRTRRRPVTVIRASDAAAGDGGRREIRYGHHEIFLFWAVYIWATAGHAMTGSV
jgi:hypothetical protein